MDKEEFFKDEDGTVFKTVEHADGSMKPFVFQHKTNVWVNVPVGHLAQAQWNGWQIDRGEAEEIIERQKKEEV